MTQQKQTQIDLFIFGRASYLYVDAPYVNKDGKSSFKSHILLDPAHPGFPELGIKPGAHYIELVKDAQRKVAAAAWASPDMLASLAHKDKLALHDGSLSFPGKEDYKGKVFVSANANVKNRPTVVVSRGGKNVPLVAGDKEFPYSGCWAMFHVGIWAQEPDGKTGDWGPRVNAQLMGVQFVKHDTAFGGGGRVSSPEEFGVIASEADAPVPGQQAQGGGSASNLF